LPSTCWATAYATRSIHEWENKQCINPSLTFFTATAPT
jgi:hypothetical protein